MTPSFKGLKNDLAILTIQDEVSLSETIKVINLPNEDITCSPGTQFVVSGWGKDRYKNQNISIGETPPTRFLQALKLDCLDISECKNYGDDDPSLVFCVGDRLKRQNSICQGDSGGNG